MGRPRMNRVLPTYASEFIDRHGKVRVRLRRTGYRTAYTRAKPGTPEFTEEYLQWEATGKRVVGEAQIVAGTFDDLITRFYKSGVWNDLKESTRETYRGEMERFRAVYGSRQVATMTTRHIANLMAKMKETPSAANNLKKRLGQLFDHAALLGMRKDNPAKAVRGMKGRKGGFATWQEAQIEAFEAMHPIGAMARLAFDLALYTAQRKSDVRLMGPQHVERGKIRVKQLKTDKPMMIPIHPALARSIAATGSGHLAFIVNAKGSVFTNDSFGMWFMRQCRKADLIGFSMHGLRKAASRRMAETGLSNQLIKSITGHTTDVEVARYTRDAEQERMADMAVAIMVRDNPEKPDLANPKSSVVSKG